MAMKMMTIIYVAGACMKRLPFLFFGSLFIFSLALQIDATIYIGLHHRLSVYRINKTQTHIKLFFYTGKISIYYDERERGSLLCFKRYCECLGLNIR
jgi:hypothetical protein